MDKSELQACIDKSYTYKQLAEHFEVSKSTVRHWMKKFGLKTLNNQYNNAGNREFLGCKICGESDKNKFYKRRGDQLYGICIECFKKTHGKKRADRTRSIKKEWLDYKGGECEECGYKKCPAALEFHHLDPSQKDPNWRNMRSWSLEMIRSELDKCQLLCSNCHKEVHYGDVA